MIKTYAFFLLIPKLSSTTQSDMASSSYLKFLFFFNLYIIFIARHKVIQLEQTKRNFQEILLSGSLSLLHVTGRKHLPSSLVRHEIPKHFPCAVVLESRNRKTLLMLWLEEEVTTDSQSSTEPKWSMGSLSLSQQMSISPRPLSRDQSGCINQKLDWHDWKVAEARAGNNGLSCDHNTKLTSRTGDASIISLRGNTLHMIA